jgi:hydroxymethylglutaryl-CoA synthase
MNVAIAGVGAAGPALRLAAAQVNAAWGRGGGKGAVAVCGADEDTLTLAWAAADAACSAAGIDPADLGGIWWGTTRPPFAEGPSLAVLAAALGAGGAVAGAQLGGSTIAGIDALCAAADAVGAGSVTNALVVVSDALQPGPGTGFEARCGAGAAAVVLTATSAGATVGVRVTRSAPLLDRYRGDDDRDTRDLYDPRLFREAIFLPLLSEVIEALAAAAPGAIDGWALPDPDGRLGAVLAKRAGGVAHAPAAYTALGDTGAAAALLGAIGGLATPGRIAVVGYGGGRATGVCIDISAPVAGASAALAALTAERREISYPQALRARGRLVPAGETIPMGVPPESAMFVRGAQEMLQLLGGRCVDCGTINTPPSIHPHCIACGGPKLEPVQLAREGTVHTYVVNHTMPAPFEAPLPIAVLDLDDGARVMLQVASDGSDVEIGRRCRLVLRRYAYERGVPVYGYKALPIVDRATKGSP